MEGESKAMRSMKSSRFLLVTATVAMLAIAGCKGKEQTAQPQPQQEQGAGSQQATPPGHPPTGDQTVTDINKAAHANIKTQKEVSLSPEVKAKWKEVKLDITDASSNSSQVVTVNVGASVTLKPGVKLKVEAFVPDYAISDNRIESRSNEAKNPAVLVELQENDKTVAKGWVFKEFPEFNSYTDARFPMKLVAPGVAKAAQKK